MPNNRPEGVKQWGFDAIIGNPPFQSQLSSRTAHDRGIAALIGQITEGRSGAYTDSAAIFLDRSLGLVCLGGAVSMLLPQSVLASRDADRIRRFAGERAWLEHLWLSSGSAFEGALVSTCAPVLRLGARAGAVTRSHTTEIVSLPDYATEPGELTERSTWAFLGSGARGVPAFQHDCSGTLSDHAGATADFRDEYYGLVGAIVEASIQLAPNHPRIVTSGLLDPALCLWGKKSTRIHKRLWNAPVVDIPALADSPSMLAWLEKRLVPKVMVATQTRTLEAFADPEGAYVPCMPVLSVFPKDPARIWHVAALICSPVLSAIALNRHAGAARSADALKVAARQLLELPAPADQDSWDKAALAFQDAQAENEPSRKHSQLRQSGQWICNAFGLSDSDVALVMPWWVDRMTKRR